VAKKKVNPHHHELEVKIAADSVQPVDFRNWCVTRGPSEYVRLTSPDVYYTQGKNVLRHRLGDQRRITGAGELTVKQRTSSKSTKNRVEVDLRFSEKTTREDVERFLEATGWSPAFTVIKDCCIFFFLDQKPGVEVVIYTVRCIYPDGRETEQRRFLEIEIHKADSQHVKALTTLKNWEEDIRSNFQGLGETQDQSLYEIYSGKRYNMVKEKA
jgi:hypothetical protein